MTIHFSIILPNSPEVAQFVNLSIPECRAIIERYYEEEEREMFRIREK